MTAPARGRVTNAWRGGSRDGRAGWRIQFSFDEDVITRLKAEIPAEAREWNPEGRYWWVAIEWCDRLTAVLPGLDAYRQQEPLSF